LRKATISFVISVFPSVLPSAWNNSAPTGRIFIKFYAVIPRLTKIIRSGVTFVSRNLR
jgi:hypothetical protein